LVPSSPGRKNIVVIDDEITIREMLCDLLNGNNFNVLSFADGSNIENVVRTHKIDLVILDLKLKNESGLDLAQSIKNHHGIPIIMMTGIGDEIDKVIGLEMCADDYVMKPFNTRELVARIRAVLRRSTPNSDLPKPENNEKGADENIKFGEFSLNVTDRTLTKEDNKEIPLTNTEFRVLEFLLINANSVVEREQILDYLGIDHTERYVDRNIDVIIMRLRRKIETSPSKPKFLQTRRYLGYIFIVD